MSTSLRRAQPPPGLRPLLSSFPTPPTHIPASPAPSTSPPWGTPTALTVAPFMHSPLSAVAGSDALAALGPPPSGPPAAPLPPLPEGPSPVTHEEQIAFITMRRSSYASTSSRLSVRSHHSRRSSSNSNSENEGSGGSSAVPVSPAVSAVFKWSAKEDSKADAASEQPEHDDDRSPTPSPRASGSGSTTLSVPHPPNAPRTPSPLQTRSSGDEDSILLERLDMASDDDVRTPESERNPLQAEDEGERDGAASPDIKILIERTYTPRSRARARTTSLNSHSMRNRSRSSHAHTHSAPSSIKRLKSTPTFGSDFYPASRPDAPPFPVPLTPLQDPEDEAEPEWDEGDHWDEIWEDADGVAESALEADSDEDVIDLRTPLPHLMLRAGLLSPHSKLLPRPSPSPSPEPPLPSSRPNRANTLPAPAKKIKPPRDDRDTEKRRQRHKDGRLLRGGIGLTTGLGWSDSEDEDAPSALTHRLSRLAPSLSRKSSMASSLASSSHSSSPYARSPSIKSTFSRSTSAISRSPSGNSAISRSPSANSIGSRSPTGTGSASSSSVALTRSTSTSTIASTSTYTREAKVHTAIASISALPYLSPVTSVYGHTPSDDAHVQEIEMPISDYPYSFPPPTPTDQGHSLLGHDELTPPLHVSGSTVWRAPRSPLFDSVDPFARQYNPPGHVPAQEPRDMDRSPTPTNSNASGTASTASLPMPRTPREEPGEESRYRSRGALRKASMPALQQEREDEFDVSSMPRPRAVRSNTAGPRPVSKALPPLPNVDVSPAMSHVPTISSTPPTPQPAARTSGIPKTTSLSSIRSVANAQAQSRLRERATSSASVQSARSARSVSSTASSVSGQSTASKPRSPLGTPKVAPGRKRTSSTSSSSSAAMKPLKSAIKPPSSSQLTYRYGESAAASGVGAYGRSAIGLPVPRFPSHAAAGQTGIAI